MSAALAYTPIAEAPTNIKLQIHRTYKAEPRAIFDAWTKPELLKEWFAPSHLTIAESSVDPRVGGSFRIVMEGPAPDDPASFQSYTATGVYTVFEPGKLLVFTWGSACAQGEESLVTIALKPVEGGTELLLTHEHFTTEDSRDRHNMGWTLSLDNLEKFFA